MRKINKTGLLLNTVLRQDLYNQINISVIQDKGAHYVANGKYSLHAPSGIYSYRI